jgi:hypothetical protein
MRESAGNEVTVTNFADCVITGVVMTRPAQYSEKGVLLQEPTWHGGLLDCIRNCKVKKEVEVAKLGALKSHPKMCFLTKLYKDDVKTLKLPIVEKRGLTRPGGSSAASPA